MATNPWDNDPIVTPQQASPFGSRPVIQGPPPEPKTPTPQTPEQRTSTVVGTAQTQQNTQFKPVEVGSNLGESFRADPAVKAFREVLPQVAAAESAAPGGPGDISVIYAWAKAMDPLGSVREGDVQLGQSATGPLQRAQFLISQYRLQNGGQLPPEVRVGLIEEMRNKAKQLNQQYSAVRQHYLGLAQKGGVPADTIGGHETDLFRAQEEAYIRAHGGIPRIAGQAVNPAEETAPPPPTVTEKGFGVAPDSKTPTESGEDFRNQLFAAMKSKQIKSPADIQAFQDQYNQSHGTRWSIDLKNPDTRRAIGAAMQGKAFNIETPIPDISDRRGQGGWSETGTAAGRGLQNAATLGLDEKIQAVGDTLFQGGPLDYNLQRQYAISDYDNANHFAPRLGGQLVGGAMLPMGELNTAGQVVGKGAAFGAAYGVNSSRSPDQIISNALLGASAGGLTAGALYGGPKLLGAGAKAAGSRIAGPTTPQQNALLRAGAEEGVPVNMIDVYPQTRNTAATLESIPLSSGPIRSGIAAGREAMESRVSDLARGGTPRKDMGQAVQDAGRGFVKKANRQASRLYDRARSMAGDTPIAPNEVKTVSDALLAVEEATPGGTKAGAVIKRYAEAFKGGQNITIDGARRMRSELLSALRTDGGLSKSEATRLTGQIMGAVNRDIETGLTNAGRQGAVRAYQEADKFYAQTREEIEQNIERFIGTDRAPKSIEQTIQAMNNAASPKSGNAKALTGMLARLSPDERADYAATLAEHLGRKSKDEPFNPGDFISNVRGMSEQARRIIFGADGERSIQNLLRLAQAKKDTVARLNNSRSGQVTNYRTVLSQLIVGLPGGGALFAAGSALNGATGAVGGLAIGGTILGGARAMAKALMNEEFTRAIAQAPATSSPRAIDAHFGRLRQVASKDPNVRAVVEALEQKLLSHANDNTTKAAAASSDDTEDKKQQK